MAVAAAAAVVVVAAAVAADISPLSRTKIEFRAAPTRSGRLFFVNVDEINWIEAAGDYVSLHVGRNSHLLHETMTGLENKLNPQKFLRIHRSTIVNSDRIKELQPHINGEYHVFLKNGIKLKLSRRYRKNLQALFGDSL